MTTRISYRPGTALLFAGKPCVVIDIVDLSNVLVRLLETKKPQKANIAELALMPEPVDKSGKKTTRKIGRIREDIVFISDAQWDAATAKLEAIRPILNSNPGSRHPRIFQKIAEAMGCHMSTVYEWVATYESTRLLSSLTRRPRSDAGKARIDRVREAIIAKAFADASPENRLNPKDMYEEVEHQCKLKKLTPVPYSTIRRRVLALPAYTVSAAREGKKRATEKHKPIEGSFPEQPGPLYTTQMDHTPVDLIFVDEEHREPVGGRATLTVLTDVNSRMTLGFNLAFEAPSAHIAGACVVHAVLPKERYLLEQSLKVEWPCWGQMATINTDNASEFVGTSFGLACKEWEIELTQRPLGRPNFAGQVERLFRTFMRVVHKLPGTTYSNVAERLEYDSAGRAILTIKEFRRWFTIFVTHIYHQRRHRSLGMPPIQKWELGLLGTDEKPGSGLPERISNETKFRIDFLPHVERMISRDGIALECLHFWDDTLRPWINAKHPSRPKEKRKFIVKFDPFLANMVYFWDPELKQYFEVWLRDRSRPHVTLAEVRAAKDRLAKKNITVIDEDMIFEGIKLMREEVAKAAKKTKSARRSRERLKHAAENSAKAKQQDSAPEPAPPVASIGVDAYPVLPLGGTEEPPLPQQLRR
jgi:putative transposase